MQHRPIFRLSSATGLALGTTLILALGLAVATLTPLPRVVSVGGGDKLHHVVGFAALILPIAVLRPRWLLVAAPVMLLYGGLIELIQPFVGRSCELADWLADGVGVALGSVFGGALHLAGRWLMRLRRGGPTAEDAPLEQG